MAPEVISLPSHDQRKKLEEKRPELRNTAFYGSEVDIWAVGILTYELLVGRPPFEVEGEKETALRIMYCSEISFPCYISDNAKDFVQQALEKRPEHRPSARRMTRHAWLKPFIQGFLEKSPSFSSTIDRQRSFRRARFNDQPVSDVIPSGTSLPSLAGETSPKPQSPRAGGISTTTLPPISQYADDDSNSVPAKEVSRKSKLKRNLTLPNKTHFDQKAENGAGSAAAAATRGAAPSKPEAAEPQLCALDTPPLSPPHPVEGEASTSKSAQNTPSSRPNNDSGRKSVRRNRTFAAQEVINKGFDVVLTVDDMDKLRKLGTPDDDGIKKDGSETRPTSLKGRIVSYLHNMRFWPQSAGIPGFRALAPMSKHVASPRCLRTCLPPLQQPARNDSEKLGPCKVHGSIQPSHGRWSLAEQSMDGGARQSRAELAALCLKNMDHCHNGPERSDDEGAGSEGWLWAGGRGTPGWEMAKKTGKAGSGSHQNFQR
eukprot:CAMPEP_0177596716 /NCGR_PEP_ID=MMETSP0419_2-20121207/11277_1 /TAXON_ID=582737 /ORGANISM="Tetraselmis sp., Strain GSL018" /LENGTH=485 /DNA_ID=CAMNT_0019088739 /DNA_START=848 /DNA_END=2307 /DNA_ORIENTATION=+